MKKLFFSTAILFSITVIISCSKAKTDPSPTTNGTFTISGTAYTESKGSYAVTNISDTNYASLGVYGTNGTKKGELIILFPGNTKPAAGTYTIATNTTNAPLGTNMAAIIASDSTSVAHEGLYSAQSGIITVAVSSANKLTITIPSITFKGSNFDNTDPKNTVITDVTLTVTGTVNEN